MSSSTKKKTSAPRIDAVQGEQGGYLTRTIDGVETVLTIEGQPVPVGMAHLIPYGRTDQGIAESNEGKDVVYTRVVRDEWDQTIAKRSDPSVPVWDSPDPMADAVKRYGRPGMAHKFLSPRHIDKKGFRHFEIVKDGDGREVKVGNMLLGEMPEEMRDARNRHYREVGNAEVRQAEDAYRADQERTLRDAGIGRDMASVLHSGEHVQDVEHPNRTASIGVRVQRGAPL